jgi:hypothetical protein
MHGLSFIVSAQAEAQRRQVAPHRLGADSQLAGGGPRTSATSVGPEDLILPNGGWER